jgi:hypothetical protein
MGQSSAVDTLDSSCSSASTKAHEVEDVVPGWDALECQDECEDSVFREGPPQATRAGALLRSLAASGRKHTDSLSVALKRSERREAKESSRSWFLGAIGGAVGNVRHQITSLHHSSAKPAHGDDDSCAVVAPTSDRLASLSLDLEAVEDVLKRTCPVLDWDDENSVMIHSAANTLRNNFAVLEINLDLQRANTAVGKIKSALRSVSRKLSRSPEGRQDTPNSPGRRSSPPRTSSSGAKSSQGSRGASRVRLSEDVLPIPVPETGVEGDAEVGPEDAPKRHAREPL